MSGNLSKLEMNSYLYEANLNVLDDRRSRGIESYLNAIEKISHWAWYHHPGRFADGALENHAFEIGRKLENKLSSHAVDLSTRKAGKSRTMHIATTLFHVGGHTRVLATWCQRDPSADHVVVLTDQRAEVPSFFQEIITRSGNHCICLPTNTSIQDRAIAVRRLSQSCDRVILHTHPHDSIPVVAFAREGGPPVAMFNHAHFGFSLGSTVSDLIINTLQYFQTISIKHRNAKSTALLPKIGMKRDNRVAIDKEAARRKLSLPEGATIILSIAQEHYFRPMEGYDFFRTAKKIFQRLPEAYLMLVGVGKGSPLVPPDLMSNPRLLLMGVVENPAVHYEASDLCLESFPMPSLGAVIEAIAYGEAYPVPMYGIGESILRIQYPVDRFPPRAPDEEGYVSSIARLLERKNDIRAEAREMRARIEENDEHLESGFRSQNSLIDGLTHNPGEILVSRKIESDDCRTLAELDQSDIGKKIDDLFPFFQSALHHLHFASQGCQSYPIALKRILSRMCNGLSRHVRCDQKP
jgi:hypothetical protein